MSLPPGIQLGPYQILAPLGAGGMGEVYKGKGTRLDRVVAVKVLPERLAQSPESLARFEREAKAVAALSHPNILGIHDFATQGERACVVMEVQEGESLRARLAQGPLQPRRAAELAIQVAQGLAAAHAKGSFAAVLLVKEAASQMGNSSAGRAPLMAADPHGKRILLALAPLDAGTQTDLRVSTTWPLRREAR